MLIVHTVVGLCAENSLFAPPPNEKKAKKRHEIARKNNKEKHQKNFSSSPFLLVPLDTHKRIRIAFASLYTPQIRTILGRECYQMLGHASIFVDFLFLEHLLTGFVLCDDVSFLLLLSCFSGRGFVLSQQSALKQASSLSSSNPQSMSRNKSGGLVKGVHVQIIAPPHNSKRALAANEVYDQTGIVTREGSSANGGWFEIRLDDNKEKAVYYRRGALRPH